MHELTAERMKLHRVNSFWFPA